MTPRPREAGLKVAATVVAIGVNGVLFGGMALAGMIRGRQEEPPPPIPVEIVEIVQKGEERDKRLLPRKPTAPPPEPPPEEEAVRTAPPEEEIEKKKEEEKKRREEEKRRAEEERKRKEEEERKRKEEEERRRKAELERERKEEERRRRARQRAMQRALAAVGNEDAPPEGHPDGVEGGNTTDPTKSAKFLGYIGRLSLILQRHFEVPAVIPHDERQRLVAEVSFRLGPDGKLQGEPRITRSSGNRFFDDAALRAVRKFGPGTPLKLPLPSDPKLRTAVLKNVLRPNLHGK